MDNQTKELLPCPFCGGKPKIEQWCKNGYSIKCTSCVIGIKQKVLRKSMEWLKETMISDWNKRTIPSPAHTEVTDTAQQFASQSKGEGWVSVEDRLPEVGGEYNIVWDLEDGDKPVSSTMEFDGIKKIWIDIIGAGQECKTVLYWRPLPTPPLN